MGTWGTYKWGHILNSDVSPNHYNSDVSPFICLVTFNDKSMPQEPSPWLIFLFGDFHHGARAGGRYHRRVAGQVALAGYLGSGGLPVVPPGGKFLIRQFDT